MPSNFTFNRRILAWFDRHGRKNLPWQKPRTPYRVWLSEIMLQQTQVQTVIAYFQRFIKRFPTVKALASAEIDEVLALWSGLGYYARARNLYRCAQLIMSEHQGKFPSDLTALQALPGIGRSTAGAIITLGFKQPAPILDGNVKRVLCRFHAIAGWPGLPAIAQRLWEWAEKYLPRTRNDDYTQALMDLGALVCTRSQPQCTLCPLRSHCLAYAQGNPTNYPHNKPRKTLPVRAINLLLLCNKDGAILLEKRPATGIWGGLWSLPETTLADNLSHYCVKSYHCKVGAAQIWPSFRHTFTHFHLDITPIMLRVISWRPPLMDSTAIVWYNIAQAEKKGLAAPVKKLLLQLKEHSLYD